MLSSWDKRVHTAPLVAFWKTEKRDLRSQRIFDKVLINRNKIPYNMICVSDDTVVQKKNVIFFKCQIVIIFVPTGK